MSDLCGNTETKGPAHRRAWRRVAKHGEAIILDLGSADPFGEARAVEITAAGWRLLEPGAVPVAFFSPHHALPLPEPIAGAARFDDLARFVNCAKAELPAVWAWLVAALRPFEDGGAYPILALTGESGSGKTLATRFLQSLVDPSSLWGVALPRVARDIYESTGARHLLAYDNLSGLRGDMADALCRVATGGAFVRRALFSDVEGAAMMALNPQLINGITASFAARPDVAERCVAVELSRPAHFIPQGELIAQWKAARPGLLGLICDGLSAALRNLDRVTLEGEAPRMGDAALWVVAAAQGLGIEPGAMVAAWRGSRLLADRAAVAGDGLARAAVALVAEMEAWGQPLWRGDPAATKSALEAIAGESAWRAPTWPASSAEMALRLKRLAPVLHAAEGIEIESGHDNAGRWISLRRLPEAA
jgi:hypothetical protein